MPSAKHERGIRQTGSGWQAYVRIAGEFRSKHFPPTTPLVELRRWRETQKARALLQLPDPTAGASFALDVDRYLDVVAGMITFSDRARHIKAWLAALGPRCDRVKLTGLEIREVLERWRRAGLSAGSLNLRRTALMHLFTVLDGKAAPNPVRDVPRYPEPAPRWHLPSAKHADKAIAAVSRDRLNKSRVRLTLLRWTGWPSAQVKRLTPDALDLKRFRVRLTGRKKGRGTPDVWMPILPQAVKALKAFRQAGAFGPFSNSSLHKALRMGCKRAKVTPFRVYDLRHLFLTEAALAVRDDRVVAALGMHRDSRITARYTEQSVDPRLAAGMKRLAKRWA